MTEEPQRTASDLGLPGGSFQLLVQKMAYQALMSLGVMDNPLTGKGETDLVKAKMVLDDLEMLREKTRGNLEEDEREHLEVVLTNLRERIDKLES